MQKHIEHSSEGLDVTELRNAELTVERDELLKLVKEVYWKVNSEYLDLLSKYAGTRFENDPPIVKLRDWVRSANALKANP